MAGKKISQLSSGSLSNLPLSGLTAVVYSGITHQHSLSNLRQKLVDSGSHVFTGSQVINGNLTISGSITAQQYILSSSITNITTETISGSSNFGNSSDDIHRFTGSLRVSGSIITNGIWNNEGMYISGSVVIGESVIINGPNTPKLHVKNSGSFNIAHFEANNEYYAQVNITNINSGSLASSDLVLTANNGNETVHFVNLGINSSTYNGGYVGYENDAYLLNVGKDLYIGTVGGTSHPAELKLFVNNSWEDPQITVHTGSEISFNTSSVTSGYLYEFSGSVKLQDELKVDGSVTASYFVGDGSQLTNLPVQTTNVSMFLSSSTFNSFTSSYNNTSASFDSRITAATNEQDLSYLATTGSNTFVGNQIISGSKYLVVETIQNLSASLNLITDGDSVQILGSNLNVPNGGIITNFNVSASAFTGSLDWLYLINVPTLISASSQIQYSGLTGIPSGIVSGSSQILYGSGIWSGSAQLPSGIISGSSQLPSGLVSGSSQISYTGITDVPGGIVSGSSQIGNLGYAITGSNTFIGDQTINGSLIIEGVSEVITVDGGFNGNRTFDYTSGSIFYLTGLTGNGVWNVNNVPTTNNRTLTLTYVIEQGATAYSGSQYQINGSNVTVKWVDNTIPTGSANNTEIIGLTAFRVGSSWNVIGSLSTFGV